MKFVFILLVLVSQESKVYIVAQDYCQITTCDGHTMCKYPDETVVPCEILNIRRFQKEILHRHNQFRSDVAMNKTDQPPAADMLRLVWDTEISNIAEMWGKQCQEGKDSCRDVGRFPVGQNIAESNELSVPTFLNQWFDDKKCMTSEIVGSFSNNPVCPVDKYTQVVWSRTQYIGCAIFNTFKENNPFTLYCNYGPEANEEGDYVYRVGRPQSECGSDARKDDTYEGLCDKIEEIVLGPPLGAVMCVRPTASFLMLLATGTLQHIMLNKIFSR